MKKKFSKILILLLAILMIVSGCSTNSSQITPLEKPEQTEEDSKNDIGDLNISLDDMFIDGKMELPEDGIVTQSQMELIAGTDAVYEFYSEDEQMHIVYYWSYEGKKIQNPVEQNMKVYLTTENVDEVKKAANNASVGLGVTLAKANLAAPARLTLQLPEKWDADMVILCKLVDGVPQKMCDVEIGTWNQNEEEYSTLTIPVNEMGDTYYLVGGKTKADGEKKSETTQTGNAPSDDDYIENSEGSDSSQAGAQSSQGNQNNNADNQVSNTCKISIDCLTILNNLDDLNTAKSEFVPSDGWILYTSEVDFTPGETVYDVLYRVCRAAGIHMEASYTPAYSSYYVEGINQLYEFDCGSLSGWMYSVNGWFPNYGCSKYEVSDGDVIEWRYTCDLGRDVGDQYYE